MAHNDDIVLVISMSEMAFAFEIQPNQIVDPSNA